MRIGIDARMYGPTATTGIGVYIQQLIDQIMVLDSKNEYILFMKKDVAKQFSALHNRITVVGVDIHWYGVAEQLLLPFIFLRQRLDILHVPHLTHQSCTPKNLLLPCTISPLNFFLDRWYVGQNYVKWRIC